MAIYTQYGRYIKAKHFKEMLEKQGDTYMMYGIGNPKWDNNAQEMPNAPYDITCTSETDSQFEDTNAKNYILTTVKDGSVFKTRVIENTLNSKYKNLLPKFPSIWYSLTDSELFVVNDTSIMQNEYEKYYILTSTEADSVVSTVYKVNNDETTNTAELEADTEIGTIDFDSLDDIQKQYYADLYLRGLSLTNYGKALVGLVGAIKCSIAFVRDLGTDFNDYTGSANQFWYGDRYWEIVEPSETDIFKYLDDTEDDSVKAKTIYPHHLLINAIINPGALSTDFIDHYLVPRQIAICTKSRLQQVDDSYQIESSGKNSYKVSNTIFNFGQFTEAELADISSDTTVLNCTLPCKDGDDKYVNGDFKFILHDYVKGQLIADHTVNRLAYIIGF